MRVKYRPNEGHYWGYQDTVCHSLRTADGESPEIPVEAFDGFHKWSDRIVTGVIVPGDDEFVHVRLDEPVTIGGIVFTEDTIPDDDMDHLTHLPPPSFDERQAAKGVPVCPGCGRRVRHQRLGACVRFVAQREAFREFQKNK